MNRWVVCLVIVLIVIAVYLFLCWRSWRFLWKCQQDSLIVFGKRGHGKSLLFSCLARQWAKHSKAHAYASNTDFKHKGGEVVDPHIVNVEPNDWEDVLNDRVEKIKPANLEGKAIFLDDAGVYLPNFADNLLKKKYASMPIAIATWRHLYNAPIHINSQDVERCWKMVREQADGFLKARRVIKIGPFFRIALTYFEKIDSATKDLAPIKKRILRGKGDSDVYNAEHGFIKDFAVWGICKHHKYDSRYFRKVFFSVSNEDEEEKPEEENRKE